MTEPAALATRDKKREIVEWLRSLMPTCSEYDKFEFFELKNTFKFRFISSGGCVYQARTAGKALHHLEDMKSFVETVLVKTGLLEWVPF